MVAGLTGAGMTGSYIFSQTIFSMRAGVKTRIHGIIIAGELITQEHMHECKTGAFTHAMMIASIIKGCSDFAARHKAIVLCFCTQKHQCFETILTNKHCLKAQRHCFALSHCPTRRCSTGTQTVPDLHSGSHVCICEIPVHCGMINIS